MKKLMMIAVASMFIFAGCEEKKAEAAVEQAKPVEQPAQPEAKKAPAPSEVAVRAGVQSVDWDKAIEMNANGAIYVDVRNAPELNEGFAPHALNIPLNELKERIGELPKDKDLLIYCRSGKRSMAASNFLIENGYEKVFNVVGGFLAFPKQ